MEEEKERLTEGTQGEGEREGRYMGRGGREDTWGGGLGE